MSKVNVSPENIAFSSKKYDRHENLTSSGTLRTPGGFPCPVCPPHRRSTVTVVSQGWPQPWLWRRCGFIRAHECHLSFSLLCMLLHLLLTNKLVNMSSVLHQNLRPWEGTEFVPNRDECWWASGRQVVSAGRWLDWIWNPGLWRQNPASCH